MALRARAKGAIPAEDAPDLVNLVLDAVAQASLAASFEGAKGLLNSAESKCVGFDHLCVNGAAQMSSMSPVGVLFGCRTIMDSTYGTSIAIARFVAS